ncbi:MAG TPA: bifunctional 5,10-methylenetetrahydrofolate dehydrogenase/5,10-methenyltetrahydrofolate cyclohydrolase [Candidatus Dormibacteraeota bacterium]|jgi:methylenetetrahydrofolate dehydrogenase (NADP+)/methenyltetrahydrofolate cyclohydrolase|nr:bifunctional 5,10-methylenetetrahydrofolate dehydrogenase/5,10-methenyltetrahydrofolate cyclohydrolase [Candidatus Dormibacteraeota bacterium]
MSARIIDGRAVAADIEEEVRQEIVQRSAAGLVAPGLHVVLCGDDPASATYVGGKQRASERVGIRSTVHRPPDSSTTEELLALVAGLNVDDGVDAILVQLPLPPQVDAGRVLDAVSPEKDVDGFHPFNFGLLAEGRPRVVPCTPAGLMQLLARYEVPVRGARAVIVGRSTIVGRPTALLLTNADATVTVCHSRTQDLPGVCREADILVAATGKPHMIDAAFVKPGACVLDVGTTRVEGKLSGDVDRVSVEPVAGWLTPVPGGVGPMTIAMLMRNATDLARGRQPVPVAAG